MIRVTDANDPGFAPAVADDAAVPAGIHECVCVPALREDRDSAVHRPALRDATEVDAHSALLETYGLLLRIEQHVTIIDCRERGADLLLGRPHMGPEVVHIPDAGIGDVEGAFGDARILERGTEQRG